MNCCPGQLQWSYDSCGFASPARRLHFSAAAAGCFFRRRYENPPAGVKDSLPLERASLRVLFAWRETSTAEQRMRPLAPHLLNRRTSRENLTFALCGLSSPFCPSVPHVVEAAISKKHTPNYFVIIFCLLNFNK